MFIPNHYPHQFIAPSASAVVCIASPFLTIPHRMRLFVLACLFLACALHGCAAASTEKMQASKSALIDALYSSRNQPTAVESFLAQQQIQGRHAGVAVPAQEGARVRLRV